MTVICDENHVYTVNGVKKPGVSEIMEAAGLIDRTWFNEHACLRGQYVHRAIQLHHTDGLDRASLDAEILPYFAGSRVFLRQSGFRPVLVETPMHDPIYDFCGTPDLIGWLGDRLVLIDVKTGAPADWHKIQTAAYQHLAGGRVEGMRIASRVGLYLSDTGRYTTREYVHRNDISVFLAALTILNFKNGKL